MAVAREAQPVPSCNPDAVPVYRTHGLGQPRSHTVPTPGSYPAEDAGLLEEYPVTYPSGTDGLLRF